MSGRAVVTLTAKSGEVLTFAVEEVRGWMFDPPRAANPPVQHQTGPRTLIYMRELNHPIILCGDHQDALRAAVTGEAPCDAS